MQHMRRGSTLFLKIVLLVIAILVMAGLLWFPQTEGRAANLDLMSIYADPFIIYIYIGSIPFFVGLYQAYTLVKLIEVNKFFSQHAVNTLKHIRATSFVLVGMIAVAEIYIRFFVHGDDPAGPTMMGIVVSLGVLVVATVATIFQKLLQRAMEMKSENDLTVWGEIMAIIINIDVMLAKRKMSVTELTEKVGITMANLSILKNGKARAIRFSTLEAICKALDCQPGDILEYKKV